MTSKLQTRPARASRARNQRGTMIPLLALVILTLVAFMGLAFDASFLYFEKRRVQTAADAGAIAGAQELLRRNATNVTAAARKDAQLNRFTHGTNSIDVAVNNPPLSGTRVGDSGFVEVIVSEPRPTWFMQVVGNTSSTVRARAVAGLVSSGGCVYSLNRVPGSNTGIFMNGTVTANFNCGVYSNSTFRAVGGACINAPSASYVTDGGYNNHDGTCGPAAVGQGIPVVDPMLGRFTMPTVPSTCTGLSGGTYTTTTELAAGTYCDQVRVGNGGVVTLNPGMYYGGIRVDGTAVFRPGSYVLVGINGNKGGLDIQGSAIASGSGVTFFNTYQSNTNQYKAVTINGTANFSAPITGSYAGLLFYQDPRVPGASNNGSTITGTATSTFDGILYFPTTDLTYSGNSSTNGYTIMVSYNLTIAGNSQVGSNYSSLPGGNPLAVAAFVE